MRVILIVLMLLARPVWAQDSAAPGIEATISNQMEAFLADDVDRAFTYASPGIRGFFRTPDRFGSMVREGYPMVWRPKSFTFGELREINGVLWQKVIVQDADGALHALDYRMIQTDGDWRIDAVQMLPAPDLSA
ncbi:DUF4864 domain-containing protein [Mesobacterium sp. TK19101]|uniref:DUF4864 domain-containing protein n=1 Tax=Mesobacterium hydrothermale TaxID=3111907 RepID=A0ABU6HJ99_9RHOB|nr:DUF4864 domain-containing protein [Mesobacterium sp. TK19101]MEC3861939.1 DUF4864 domain-containing protein [Mesobacterium sp. TK19101]